MSTHAVSLNKSGMTNGFLLGGVLSLLVLFISIFNPTLFTQWWVGVVIFILGLAGGIVSVATLKKLLNGFISFRQAFQVYFITIAVGLFIGMLTGILIFRVINPEIAVVVQEKNVKITEGFMQKMEIPQSEIEKQTAEIQQTENQSLGSHFKTYFYGLTFMSVFGLLVALNFRRKSPDEVL